MFKRHITESQPTLPRFTTEYPTTELLTPELTNAIVSRREDYLDRVFAPLTHLLPFARRQELRMEMRQHLDAMIGAYVELGETQEKACDKAFAQFGQPEAVAESIKKAAVYPSRWQRTRAWFAQPRMSVAGALPVLVLASALYFGLARPVPTRTQTTEVGTQVAALQGHRIYTGGVHFSHQHAIMVDKIPCASCHRSGDITVVSPDRILQAQAVVNQAIAQQARDQARREHKQ